MKIFTGKIVSAKTDKTVTVDVERVVIHSLYRKRLKRGKKYHVHDEIGAKVGQTVRFVACKPFSKLKKWKVIEIVGLGAKSVTRRTRKTRKNIKDFE